MMMSTKQKYLSAAVIAGIMILTSVFIVKLSQEETEKMIPVEKHVAEWTSFFWLCGDGNLADWNMMLCNLHYLEMVENSEDVNLIGILDRKEDGDTKLLKIEKGNSTEMPITLIDSTWTDSELNLGDPDHLLKFLTWGADNYPAENYNIHLVNHGGGWRGMCWDESSNDHLSLPEIREVSEGMKEHVGKNVEILSTEGCLVGMIEFGYELRESVDYFIGGSTYGWGAEAEPDKDIWEAGNWQYDECWGRLVENPAMSPEELSLVMIETFKPYGPWTAPPFIPKEGYSDVMAAYNLSKIENLSKAVDSMARELLDKVTGPGQTVRQANLINNVIGHPEMPDGMYTEYFSAQMDWLGLSVYTNFDLYDFAFMLSRSSAGTLQSSHSSDVMQLVEDVIMAYRNVNADGGHPDAHGISVYIPYRSSEYNPAYEEIQFAMDTQWDEFLKAVHWT